MNTFCSLRITQRNTTLNRLIQCNRPKLSRLVSSSSVSQKNAVHYEQGQSPEPKIREYFYFIDHQGMLFLDDTRIKNFTSCFKERKFLSFFYNRLRPNNTGRYSEFPYYSPCGRERNFVRCDDLPFVYTHVVDESIYYGHAADDLREPFEPAKVTMVPGTGRVYHPAPDRAGGAGLVKSSLAIDFSSKFEFRNGESQPPTHFNWKDTNYELLTWYNPLS